MKKPKEDPNEKYFRDWLKATMTPLVKPQWLLKKRMADYQASPGANGSTFLYDTPAEMKFEAMQPPKINYAFALGDAFHIATLEPDRFDKDRGEEEYFQYSQTETLNTKKNAEAFEADPSRPIVTPDLIDKARRLRDAVYNNHLAARLLSAKAEKELSGYAWDEDQQLIRKIRLDFSPVNGNYDLDLKSADSVNEMAFWNSIKKYKYAAKCAYYADTAAMIRNQVPRELFYLIAVTGPKAENKKAHEGAYLARVFEIASPISELSLMEEGRAFYRSRLAMFANAARTGDWEGYEHQQDPEILTVFRPRFQFKGNQPKDEDDQ